MNLTPASSRDLPSEAIFTRVSESGTRLMQTAIFIERSAVMVRHQTSEQPQATSRKRSTVLGAQESKPGDYHLATACGVRLAACGYVSSLARNSTRMRLNCRG